MGTAQATRSLLMEGARGHLEAEDKEKLKKRLKRTEGQVRGLQRMVDEEAYCVDVLTRIGSVVSAMERSATSSSRTTSSAASGVLPSTAATTRTRR